MTRLIFSSLWWNEIKLKRGAKKKNESNQTAIWNYGQTESLWGQKPFRHILICCQAICYGIMSENSTKDIIFNQSLVSEEKCNIIISHPTTLPRGLMSAVFAIELWQPCFVCLCLLSGFETAVTLGLTGEWFREFKSCYGSEQHRVIQCKVPVCYYVCREAGRLLSCANTKKS